MTSLDFNLANPLLLYFILAVIAAVIRLFLVVKPIWKLLKISRSKDVKKSFNKFKKLSSLKLGLPRFFFIEISLLMIPLLMVLIFRYGVGNPEFLQWNHFQIIISVIFGVSWLATDLTRSLKVRKSLKPLQKWYASPARLSSGLDKMIWSRSKLKEISNWEIPQTEEDDQNLQDNDISDKHSLTESITAKVSVIASVLKTKAVEVSKKIAEKSGELVDRKVQDKADELFSWKNRKLDRFMSFLIDVVMSLLPLAIIYLVLPMLGT